MNRWLSSQDVRDYLNLHDYDIRKSGNARWIDQKCTPDVITSVAECIYAYFLEEKKGFTRKDIQFYTYSVDQVKEYFKKPATTEKSAEREYDKFFMQPMELLTYVGILKRTKRGQSNYYEVVHLELLEYLSLRVKNALEFLVMYIEKVLLDSNQKAVFDEFFLYEDKVRFHNLKDSFINFMQTYTPIKKDYEPRRIFTKVINPLAYKYNKHGTKKGNLSKDIITHDMLLYNRDNFRDIYLDKPKGMTRGDFENSDGFRAYKGPLKYQSQKAKRFVRLYNDAHRDGQSEVIEADHLGHLASQIHHIFPESEFRQISMYYENLIALTPTQHMNDAHMNGHTSRIDTTYQKKCLLSKIDQMASYCKHKKENIYDFSRLQEVLAEGYKDNRYLAVSRDDYDSLRDLINR